MHVNVETQMSYAVSQRANQSPTGLLFGTMLQGWNLQEWTNQHDVWTLQEFTMREWTMQEWSNVCQNVLKISCNCLINRKDPIIVPCGHERFCESCAETVHQRGDTLHL